MPSTSIPQIALVNYSNTVKSPLSPWAIALQSQVRDHFAPIWGVDADVTLKLAAAVVPSDWVLGIFDSADQAGALGYHDLTPAGKPVMKIFAKDTAAAGAILSTVASHELLETLADPFIESVTIEPVGNQSGVATVYPQEVCDPVQGDSYEIEGVSVSNFVTPWWFGDPLPAGGKFDYLGKLEKPFSMTPGGYYSYASIDPGKGLGEWTESFADERAKVLSRLSRAYKRNAARRG